MRILADENFPGLSVQELRRLGHDVLWVRTAMPGARDDAILAYAQTEERLLVTLDKDFGELAFGMRLPASCGVVLFRMKMSDARASAIKIALDELPQLYSILKGDISFVGPRPALYNQDDLVELRTKKGIHKLIPGITGWAQINGRDELPIPVKVEFDEYYLKNRSFILDLKILLMTFIKVVRREGVTH